MHYFNLTPGRQVGALLSSLQEAQAAGEVASPQEALALAATLRLIHRMFTDAGLKLDTSGLALSYLNRCPLESRWSVHMVMPAAEGPVTVMYVLGESKVERMDIRHDMVAVRTLPFASGALVLLAESNRDFDRVEDAWHQAARESVALAGGGE